MEKHSESRLSYLFAHLHLLSSYSFSSTLLSSDLSLLSASALLCSSSVHIVGSLTSKLPSNNDKNSSDNDDNDDNNDNSDGNDKHMCMYIYIYICL